jgi:hypothetical protein
MGKLTPPKHRHRPQFWKNRGRQASEPCYITLPKRDCPGLEPEAVTCFNCRSLEKKQKGNLPSPIEPGVQAPEVAQ